MFRTFGKSAGHRSICLDGTIAAGDHGTKPLLKSRAVHMLEERWGLNHPSAERRKGIRALERKPQADPSPEFTSACSERWKIVPGA